VDKVLWDPCTCEEIKCANEIEKFDFFVFQKSIPSKRCRTHIVEAVVVCRKRLTRTLLHRTKSKASRYRAEQIFEEQCLTNLPEAVVV